MLGFIAWNGTVSAGDICTMLSFVIAVFIAWARLNVEIAEIKTSLGELIRWWHNCQEGNCPMARGMRRTESEGD